MSVPSLEFLGFAILAAVVFNLSRATLWRGLVLAITNLIFFMTFLHGWQSGLPYVLFILLGYLSVRILQHRTSAVAFSALLAVLLFSFFWLKRYAFIPSALTLPFAYTTVGLSYVFFRVLHLVIDAWQGVVVEPIRPLSYWNYTLNFTSLTSGPIQYGDHRRAEHEWLILDAFTIAKAMERIVTGLFKVAVVSVILLAWQKSCIASLPTEGKSLVRAADLALIVALYPMFLYANFSGYTDFVIGVARLFRMELPENFNRPFSSENFIDFWGRWHITLSNWLKTYVYTPFLMTSMQRITSARMMPFLAVAAYFITFFLVGAWHGQTSMFLFFGVLQGGGVACNKLYQLTMTHYLTRRGYRALCERPFYRAVSRGLTFTFFAFSMLWFWSNWTQLKQIQARETFDVIVLAFVMLFGGATLLLEALVWSRTQLQKLTFQGRVLVGDRYSRTVAITAMATITALAVALSSGPPPDVVYKGF